MEASKDAKTSRLKNIILIKKIIQSENSVVTTAFADKTNIIEKV